MEPIMERWKPQETAVLDRFPRFHGTWFHTPRGTPGFLRFPRFQGFHPVGAASLWNSPRPLRTHGPPTDAKVRPMIGGSKRRSFGAGVPSRPAARTRESADPIDARTIAAGLVFTVSVSAAVL